jgi:hypothetical protein
MGVVCPFCGFSTAGPAELFSTLYYCSNCGETWDEAGDEEDDADEPEHEDERDSPELVVLT